MESKKHPLTEEGEIQFLKMTGSFIEELSNFLDLAVEIKSDYIPLIQDLEQTKSKKQVTLNSEKVASIINNNERVTNTLTLKSKQLNDILNHLMLTSFLSLDIASTIRGHLKSEYDYESRFFIKHLYTILNEGYKKIYGYTKDANQESYWIRLVKPIIDTDLSYLEKEYEEVIKIFIESKDSIPDKEERKLVVHYDHNPQEVYNFLYSINVYETVKKASSFLSLLMIINDFLKKIVSIIRQQIEELKIDIGSNNREFIKYLETLRSKCLDKAIREKLKQMINEKKNIVDLLDNNLLST